MTGETNLNNLLATMRPRLVEGTYVFVTAAAGKALPGGLDPMMTFREAEGLTAILDADAAERAGLAGSFRSRMITLDVHSSLAAVGFLAAITACLAGAGMGVNPVSAFYHDHLFVPEDRAEEAMHLLAQLAGDAQAES